MNIEFVVHAYAVAIPDFAKLLTAQLSSLVKWPPTTCEVQVTICRALDDALVDTVMMAFSRLLTGTPVHVRGLVLERRELFRRAIGRNRAAKETLADVVYFGDCDYFWTAGFWDALAAAQQQGCPHRLVFPRTVRIQRSHRLGDEEIAKIVPGELYEPDLSQYALREERKAIGGLQIVSGDTARGFGYCDGTRFMTPVDEAGGFRNTVEDQVYRSLLGGSMAIDLPGIYRMRHSESAFQSRETRLRQTEE